MKRSSPSTGPLPLATRPSLELDLVLNATAEVRRRFAKLAESPYARALRRRFESYAREIAEWEVSPPSQAQRAAMLECLVRLRERLAELERPAP